VNGVVRGGMYGYKVYMDRCGFRYKDATLRGQGGFRSGEWCVKIVCV